MVDAGINLVLCTRRLSGGVKIVLVRERICRDGVWLRPVFQKIARNRIEPLDVESCCPETASGHKPHSGVSQADSQNTVAGS